MSNILSLGELDDRFALIVQILQRNWHCSFLGLVSRSPCLLVETNQLHASFIDHPLIIHRKGENPGFLFQ